NAKQTFWTKKGVITLGFKLTETPQTILFRDWASDFILYKQNCPATIQDVLADPRAFAELALKFADTLDENKRLEAKVKAEAPYVDFARAVEASKGDIKIGEYAKILCDKDKGIDTGEIRLFALMRELGILRTNNEPLQKYLNTGYFRVKPQTFTKPNGERGLNLITLITPRGQVRLAKKLIEAIKAKSAPRVAEG
ncbi:MAG: phage antirepressor KilAC domain-containing protein, partial [Campylobacter sp.]